MLVLFHRHRCGKNKTNALEQHKPPAMVVIDAREMNGAAQKEISDRERRRGYCHADKMMIMGVRGCSVSLDDQSIKIPTDSDQA